MTGLFVACMVLAAAAPSDAQSSRRFALVVGANRGAAGEAPLHFAQADADSMARVLTEVGGFDSANVLRLYEPTADGLRAAFDTVRERVAAARGDAFLLVYYSGHADALALHLGPTTLGYGELMHLTQRAAATTRLLVVDACRSGELTAVKGLTLAHPIALPSGSDMPKGFAVLTSASAGESAQESRALGGSFFTHHLVAALRGAADVNRDGRVTLTEAYQYSAERTSASTANTIVGVQHATYRYRLQGRGVLALCSGAGGGSVAALRVAHPGIYLFFVNDSAGPLALEANIQAEPRTLWLPSGRYFVQRRTADSLAHGEVVLQPGLPISLDDVTLDSDLPLAAVAQKGAPAADSDALDAGGAPWRLAAWGGAGTSVLRQFAVPWLAGLTLSRDFGALRGDVQASFGQTTATSIREDDVALAAGARYVVAEAGLAELSLGGRLGVLYVRQTYAAATATPSGAQIAPLAQALVRLDLRLVGDLFASIEGAGRVAVVRVSDSVQERTRFTLQPLGTVGLGVAF